MYVERKNTCSAERMHLQIAVDLNPDIRRLRYRQVSLFRAISVA